MPDLYLQPDENQYLNCIRCGLCLAVCPTYKEHLVETASPRGRMALARKGLEGELDLTTNLFEQMYSCLDCLACNEICPVGLRPADLVLEMRGLQERLKPKPWKNILFENILPKPARLQSMTWPLRMYEKLGIRRLVSALKLLQPFPRKVRDLEAMLPPLPQKPLELPWVTPARGESRYRVGFFLGCAQSLLFTEESVASVSVLAHNGCTIITPKDVVCCGMPALGFGRVDLVRQQARHNITVFEKAGTDWIVTGCATCGSTLKDYGKILAEDPAWAGRAAAFSARVRDISEFLLSIPIEKPLGRIEGRVTYHDPCHLRRGQGVWRQPRDLLKLIDGLEFIELPEADWCCGSAGSQLITHYETSLKILDRKTANLARTGADYVASGCPGCQMQLALGVKRGGLDMTVVHPITLLARAYAGSSEVLFDEHEDQS